MGSALPHPEMRGWRAQKEAVEGRLGCEMPKPDRITLRKLRMWSYLLALKLLRPVSSTYFTGSRRKDVEVWLTKTHYQLRRKLELLKTYDEEVDRLSDPGVTLRKEYEAKGFVKDECYEEYKIPRGIHPEADWVKVILGPIFKAIEEMVYKLKYFVKHDSVLDRPRKLRDELYVPGYDVYVSDFSSFEAGFAPEVRRSIEFQMYKVMLRNCPEQLRVIGEYERVACGKKTVQYKYASCKLAGRRLSGEMCTSLGNTWTNFVLLTFLLKDHMSLEDMRVLVEGDDGIVAVPTSVSPKLDFSLFERSGFKMKMKRVSELAEASFCGIVSDPQDLVNLTDPWPELVAFGWSYGQTVYANTAHRMMLLRAKSMSLAYQYPSCPVLQALARYGLRVSAKTSAGFSAYLATTDDFSQWERDLLYAACSTDCFELVTRPVPIRSRLLMSKLFAIPVSDQLLLERYLDSLHGLQPLAINVPRPLWADNWNKFVCSFESGTSWESIDAKRPWLM